MINEEDDLEFIESFTDSCLFWLGVMAGVLVVGGGLCYAFLKYLS